MGRLTPTRTPHRLVLAGVIGYLLGSAPSADAASRLAGGHRDLRQAGTGNPGAANAAAVLGARWGTVVLSVDMAKGALAGLAGRFLAGDEGACLAATAAVAGHIAPPWSGFRGGKGVATSAGACLAVFPAYFPIDAAIAVAGATATHHAERTTQISCGIWVGATLLWWWRRLPNAWGPQPGLALTAFATTTSALILAKFRAAARAR